MCGIAGYVGLRAEQGEPLLRILADAQAHRGPDGAGCFVHGTVGLAHRRLAVIDRIGGDQPFRWGRYVLSYNGEVYNFRELRDELRRLGLVFRTRSDTEVVAAAWATWGVAALDRFNGMFALAVTDTETGETVLARDQFGIKPLYLACAPGRVLFASELKPLLATGLVDRRPDEVTLFRYLRFRVHDDTDRTFFAGISRLLPGELARISPDGTVVRQPYTSLPAQLREAAAQPGRPYGPAAAEEFAAMLQAAIRRRLVADVPVGTALSGGLDSSTVVATVNRLLLDTDGEVGPIGHRQQSFSAVFPGELNDEERYVDAVAARCRSLTVHKVRPSPVGFLADLEDFVRTQEEPTISTGPYAQYCVMRTAAQHVTVMIDGQGADELMAGYVPYYLVKLRELRRLGDHRQLIMELARAQDVLWRLGRFTVRDRLAGRAAVSAGSVLSADFQAQHGDQQLITVIDDLKARLENDLFRTSLQSLLRYEDRNTMRFSIEGRVPFLDTELVRLLWSLDSSAILHAGWNKRALRDAARPLLPSLITKRRNKIGFTTPESTWFRAIGPRLRRILASDSFGSRPYFDQAAALAAFDAFLAGRAAAETMLFWRMINVELWLREFVDVQQAWPAASSALAAA
ncbi:asparagine synthase (glutamine-hydrolyzing) [Microlunatus speluncae]|uniref:asparagine synthase (glutamine-hydrolyzing) n=1 Tax=Microlunatus speluncae TaxID=2594267 RepID=UPI001266519B|nr:asparagine synthase (glutamine-hydrolyzing) [Microlunatus speluncae]